MTERKLPRAILFDWDNTLVESWGVIHEAMNLTLAAMGFGRWTREETEQRVRASLRDSFPSMFGARWRDAEQIFYNSFAAIHLQHLRALPGASDMLKHLAEIERIYLGVISNKRGEYLRREADHLGWTGHFRALAGAGDAARDKPAIEHVHLALGELACGADIWLVGDADIDLKCARNAGCTPVLMRPAAPAAGEFPGHEPTFHFPDCAGLLAYLRQT
ncbi:MAG TPA: HAD family hydrolase [Dongiaceae bacterium]|jgi:phosphoglycolate phosphatase|nr:HAD family hydrolase [Dongiaceae bacterium]